MMLICHGKILLKKCGDDSNIEQMIKFMVDNELKNKSFNVIPRTVEKVLQDKMLNNIEIIIRNKA